MSATNEKYNLLHSPILVGKFITEDGAVKWIPLAGVQPAYGPHDSMQDALDALVNTFGDITLVPKGYTFCVVENNKPQEYWFTQDGDWNSVEKKNVSEGGSGSDLTQICLRISNGTMLQISYTGENGPWTNVGEVNQGSGSNQDIKIAVVDGYICVSYDGGLTYPEKLIAVSSLVGPAGESGIGVAGPQGPAGTSLYPAGTWVENVPYKGDSIQRDIVYYGGDGCSYICLASHTSSAGITPANTRYWAKLANAGAQGIQGPQGVQGPRGNDGTGVNILGSYNSYADLVAAHPTGSAGDAYLVDGDLYVWSATESDWINVGNIQGPQGEPGADGADGADGAKGDTGDPGTTIKGSVASITNLPSAGSTGDAYITLDTGDLYVWVGRNQGTSGTPQNGWKYIFHIQGPEGPQGVKGNKGDKGDNGEKGYEYFKSIVFKRSNITPETPPGYTDPDGGTFENPVPIYWYDGVPNGEERLWMTTRYFSENPAVTSLTYWTTPAPATDTADVDFEYSNAPLDTTSASLGDPTIKPYPTYPNGWYDPSEYNELLENANWMAMRKKKNGAYETQPASTHGWTILKIRGEDGIDGLSPNTAYKSIVFRKSNNNPLTPAEMPIGGSYNTPIPDNTETIAGETVKMWSDGVPEGTGLLWMSTRIFSSDGQYPQQDSWTTPVIAVDSEFMDYEFYDGEELDSNFPVPSRTSPDDEHSGKLPGDPWYDSVGQQDDPVWVAMREVSNGAYAAGSSWCVQRIKGERGESGASIHIKGTLADIYYSYDDAEAAVENGYYNENDLIYVLEDGEGAIYIVVRGEEDQFSLSRITPPPQENDAYVFNGHLYVWDGDTLEDVGQFQGEQGPAGETWYLHIRYSNDGGNTMTNNGRGDVPGAWIGTKYDTVPDREASTNPRDYIWKKWQGEDGYGYEYIYKLSEVSDVNVPTDGPGSSYGEKSWEDYDYVPEGWMDNPDDPTKDTPFCMVCYRMKVDGTWTRFRGKASNQSKAAIYTRYTSSGRGISGVTELYALGLDDGSAPARETYNSYPSGGIPQFDPEHGYTRLWNIEIITYDDGSDPTETPAACIAVWVEGRGIGSIREFYFSSPYSSNTAAQPAYPIPTASGGSSALGTWSRIPLTVNKDKPYLWNYEVVIDTNGEVLHITDPVIIAYYTYTDVEYLINTFDNADIDDGVLVRTFIGVHDSDIGGHIAAFMNGSWTGSKDYSRDGGLFSTKLVFAAGIPNDTAHNLDYNSGNALFRVYDNGEIWASEAHISGNIEASSGRFGGFRIDSDGISLTAGSASSGQSMSLNEHRVVFTDYVDGTHFGSVRVGDLTDGDRAYVTIYTKYQNEAIDITGMGQDVIYISNGNIKVTNGTLVATKVISTEGISVKKFTSTDSTSVTTFSTDNVIIYPDLEVLSESQNLFIDLTNINSNFCGRTWSIVRQIFNTIHPSPSPTNGYCIALDLRNQSIPINVSAYVISNGGCAENPNEILYTGGKVTIKCLRGSADTNNIVVLIESSGSWM